MQHFLKKSWQHAKAITAVVVLVAASQLSYLGHASAETGWLAPWLHRQEVLVANGNTALTNYEVKVTLSASFDFAGAKANGDDILFTDSDGTTRLDHWTEAYNSTAKTATLWVEVPALPANTTTTLYMYYGNPAAVPASNGTETFKFFDDFSNPAWTSLSNMHSGAGQTTHYTADETAAIVNGKFYIIGGYNNTSSNPLNANYEFDPATNIYAKKANMPTARWGVIAAAIDNKIYAFGGQLTSGAGTTAAEMYNPATNAWTTKAALPAGLAAQGITGCAGGGKMYLFYNNLAYSYNPATNSYTKLANMPSGQPMLSWGSCSYANGKVYVIGGYAGGIGAVGHTRIYNPATNSWTSGSALPFPMYGSIRENPVIGDNIYIVQGQKADSEFSSAVYQYNIPTNTWTMKSFGPHAADGVAGGVLNGKIYTFGGRQDGTGPYGLPFASVYDPALDTNQKWTQPAGNFEVEGGNLRRMVPLKGTITGGPVFFSQIQSNSYRSTGSFVLEAKGNQTANGWNSLGVQTNGGLYNGNYNGYLAPYNDFGVSPTTKTSIYKETGTTYTQLASAGTASGAQRFKVVSTGPSIALYRGATLLGSTSDTAYRGSPNNTMGRISVITGSYSTSSWDFLFVRGYAASEPTTSLGVVSVPPEVLPDPDPDPAPIPPANFSVWPDSATPASSEVENVGYELGSRFYSDVSGKVTALRFYKVSGQGAAATHTLRLWDANGNILATAITSNETASGWQTAVLPESQQVGIAAGAPFIVSYIIGANHPYAINVSQLANQGVDNLDTPLHLYQDGVAGPSGPFHAGGPGFPTQSWSSSNYWSDVTFVPVP